MLEAEEVITQEHLIEVIESIEDPQIKALFSLEYLTAGRIGEIIQRIKKKDLKKEIHKGKEYIVIKEFYTEKNRKTKKRSIPIPIFKEAALWNFIEQYIDSLESESILFPFTTRTAHRKIQKIVLSFKKPSKTHMMNANHYMRHCRVTHLIDIYDWNGTKVMKFLGWSDERPLKTYEHLFWTYLADSFGD